MARIDALIKKDPQRLGVQAPVEATYFVFEMDGKDYLQIDTYASANREMPNKISQSIQLGPEGLAALREILAKLDG